MMLLRLYVVFALMGLTTMIIGLFVTKEKLPFRAGLAVIWVVSVLSWSLGGWIFTKGKGDVFDLVCLPVFEATLTAVVLGAVIAPRDGHQRDET